MDAEKEFQALKALHEPAVFLKEGGNPVVLLPGFRFKVGGKDVQMDLLLHPSRHSGYDTRLFFKEAINGKGKNWTQHHVAGRAWWTPSWQGVKPELPWPAMLCAHLRVVT